MNRAALQRKVVAAEEKLETAERELNTALERLKAGLHADNVMVTNVIMNAFERVKAGKRDVAELKQLLESTKEEPRGE